MRITSDNVKAFTAASACWTSPVFFPLASTHLVVGPLADYGVINAEIGILGIISSCIAGLGAGAAGVVAASDRWDSPKSARAGGVAGITVGLLLGFNVLAGEPNDMSVPTSMNKNVIEHVQANPKDPNVLPNGQRMVFQPL